MIFQLATHELCTLFFFVQSAMVRLRVNIRKISSFDALFESTS